MPTGWILREMNPDDLKNHPVDAEIYGTQSLDDDMLASVKEFGVLDPMKVTKDCVILSGHRRKQHAIAAKRKAVPVLVARHVLSEAEQVIEIVESNRQREKTLEQKAREFGKLAEAKAELARKRMVSGRKTDPTKVFTEGQKGEAKSQAAAQVGMSRPTAEKAISVVKAIDKAEESGDKERAADLREKLNKGTVASAHKAAREPGQDETEPEHDPKRPTDKSGNALPDRAELLKAFSASDFFHSTEAARVTIQNNCLKIAQLIPDGKAFREHIDKALKGMFHLIESYRPAYVCKVCNGGGCQKCAKRGYVTWQSR